jgi:hypothetical protein
VSGVPLFLQLASGSFDAGGSWLFQVVVPHGLEGLSVTCASYGLAPSGALAISNFESLLVQ